MWVKMKYNAIVILSREIMKSGEIYQPCPETKERLDKGISLLKEGIAPVIIVSGGYREKYEGISLSEVMKRYAIEQGVEKGSILEEDLSKDTVSQLIFIRKNFLDLKKWKRIILVTHNWHMLRTKTISDFVFGGNYNVRFERVNGRIPKAIIENEAKSVKVFLKTFRGVDGGDIKSIYGRLLEQHPLYNKSSL